MKKLLKRCRWVAMWSLCLGMVAVANAAEPSRTYSDESPYEWYMLTGYSGGSFEDTKMTYRLFAGNQVFETGCILLHVFSPTNGISFSCKAGQRTIGRLIVEEYSGDPRSGADKIGSAIPLQVSTTTATGKYEFKEKNSPSTWLVFSWEPSNPSVGMEYSNSLSIRISGLDTSDGAGSGGSGSGGASGESDPDVYIKWNYALFFSSGTAEVTGVEPNPWGNRYVTEGTTVIPSFASDTIPVTSIGDEAFGDKEWSYGLKAATIPSSVTRIGNRAFFGCGLTKLGLPSALKTIGEQAFCECSDLTGSLKLPSGLKEIGAAAFSGCYGLTGMLTIPNGVTIIEPSTFSNCRGFTGVSIHSGVTDIGAYAFSGCSGLTVVTIPGSVTNIGEWAFFNCEGLTSVDMRMGVTSIKEAAFKNCSALTNVVIPGSVTDIGAGAFGGCTSLTNVTIPDKVIEIADFTFSNCSSLVSATIPAAVTNVALNAFLGCVALKDVVVPQCVLEGKLSDLFPDAYGSITDVSYSSDIFLIGDYAFNGCSALTNVIIPGSVTNIGAWAFFGCTSLTNVAIPDKITEIAEATFYNCEMLAHVTIGEGVTNISETAFQGCNAEVLRFSFSNGTNNNGYYMVNDDGSLLMTMDGKVLFGGGTRSELTLPEVVGSISDGIFSGNTNLTSISIPSSVTNIEDGAFAGCSGVTHVTVPQYVLDRQLRNVFPDAYTNITHVTIADGATYISSGTEGAFEGCTSLKLVVVPASVTDMDGMAFRSLPEAKAGDFKVFFKGNTSIGPAPSSISYAANAGYTNYVTDAWTGAFPDVDAKNGLFERVGLASSLPKDEIRTNAAIKVSKNDVQPVGDDFKRYAVLRYTVDGSAPTKDSPQFAAFTMKPAMEVTVGAFLYDECVMTNTYRYWNGEIAKPVIAANTSDSNTWTVTITCATKDVAVYYTTDGSVPTASSARYGSPFSVSPKVNTTVKIRAKAFKTDWKAAEANSVAITRKPMAEDGLGCTISASGGAAEWRWDAPSPSGDNGSLRSGAIGNNQESWFETIVTNKGTVSFWWKTSCEKADTGTPWDHVAFTVDGALKNRLDGQTGWCQVTCSITNDGEHVLRWTYKKDASDKAGDDCAWVAQFRWTPETKPAPTPTPTPEPVPTPTPEPVPGPTNIVAHAGMFDVAFIKSQTVTGAMYKDDVLVGTVEVKAGRISKTKGTVKISATASLIVDGRVKKFTAKAINTKKGYDGTLSGKLVFKDPIGEMAFAMGADGWFTLSNASYVVEDEKVGGKWTRTDAAVYVDFSEGNPLPNGTIEELLPDGEPVIPKGGKWSFNKNTSVKLSKDKTWAEWDTSKGSNLSSMRLTYTPKTGQFKGTFKVYALASAQGGKKQLKKYTVNVIGFVVDGKGQGEASCKKPKGGPWFVMVD